MLTPTQEDYLEAIYRIEEEGEAVYVSLLALRLGCRLPTVTRTVQKMVKSGFIEHEARGGIHLTQAGRATARHLVHRHEDLVAFLSLVLGLSSGEAESDACQLEHGMSALAAQRLHRWLVHLGNLAPDMQARVLGFRGRDAAGVPDFERLPAGKTVGWRG